MLRCLLILCLMLTALPALAERRVALVIGNGAYTNTPALANPRNDATAVAQSFRDIGFEVTEAFDLDGQGMRRALGQFTETAFGADIVAVFYAGHGIELGGRNYLVPVDAQMRSEATAKFEALALDDVIASVGLAGRLGIIMLDACRDNPFVATMTRTSGTRSVSRGLAPVSVEGENGLIVSFAATEGNTADDGDGMHSPYTTALLQVMKEPGLEIGRVFRKVRSQVRQSTNERQIPVERMQLPDEAIYLVPPDGATPEAQGAVLSPSGPDPMSLFLSAVQSNDPAKLGDFLARFPNHPQAPAARALMVSLQETAYWETVTAENTEAAYNRYLLAFPNGQFVQQAQDQIAALKPSEEKPQGTLSETLLNMPSWSEIVLSPSFDCAKASTTVEKAICGDLDLSTQDRALAKAFEGAGVISSLKRTSQRNWIALRNIVCQGWGATVEDCVRDVTSDRIKALEAGTFTLGVAPAFNCAKAGTPVEIAICQTDILARQDHILTYVYTWARDQGRVTPINQVAWVKTREALCKNDPWPAECVAKATQARLEGLLRN